MLSATHAKDATRHADLVRVWLPMTTDTHETTFPGGSPFLNEGRLLKAVEAYLEPDDVVAIADTLRYLHEVSERRVVDGGQSAPGEVDDFEQALAEAVSTAQTLAESLRI